MNSSIITLEKINKLRYTYYGSSDEAKEIARYLIEENPMSDSNDYMVAKNAFIAGYMWSQGMTEEGKFYMEQALKYAIYASERRSLVDVYIFAGNYATLDDGISEALSWYFKALDLTEAIGNQQEIPRIYNNIGTLFVECKNLKQGITYLLEAEKFSKRISDVRIFDNLYNNLSEVFMMMDDFEQAKIYIDKMEDHLIYNGSPINRLHHLINKWNYAIYLGDKTQGKAIFIEVQRLLKDIPKGNDYTLSTLAIFDALVDMNEVESATTWFEENIEYMESVNDFSNLKKYYAKLIDYYSDNNNHEKRLYYIEKSYDNDSRFNASRLNTIDRSLTSIVETREHKEKERRLNKSAYSALTDENTRLMAVNNNLRSIHDIGVQILSTTDLEQIYDILISKVNELFQVYEFAIGILNEERDAIVFQYSSKKTEGHKEITEIPLSNRKAITVDCLLNNKEILINDCENETPERYANMVKRDEVLQSLVYLPIIVNDAPYGVITVQHAQKNAFSSLHLEVFRLLSTFAAVSFKNAQHNSNLTDEIQKRSKVQGELEAINERLDYLARHDDLTGVYNRRTLERVYDELFNEARKFGQYLTVMILDIDYFKEYNDSYGHLIGDTCIVKVADTLREALKRQQDFIARYGGDEFMVILPETDEQGAEHVAETLVQAIRNLKIENTGSQVSDIVTISLGVVCKKVAVSDRADDLLIAADKALYKVKKELGRNTYHLMTI